MPDNSLMTEIAKDVAETSTNVKYLRDSFDEHKRDINKKLDDHILDDKKLQHEVLKPLWEKDQQERGAQGFKKTLYAGAYGAIAILAGYFGGGAHH